MSADTVASPSSDCTPRGGGSRFAPGWCARSAAPGVAAAMALGIALVVSPVLALDQGMGTAGPPAPADGIQVPDCWIRIDPADLELRISLLDSASVALGGDTVKVCYSRPRKLGRPIMGRLVPYGEPWRLGANEATAVHVPFPATVAGVEVEPGWYSLYAVPGLDEWRIMVNGEARRWGIPIDGDVRAADLGSGTVPSERIAGPVELLTIRLERVSEMRAEMRIEWENTRVTVPIVRR